MKALIFGIGGQDGYYLNKLLIKHEIEVIGVSDRDDNWIQGDVGSFDRVEELIKKYHPDYVFHLAAVSTTRHDALFSNHRAISTGTLNILECARLYCSTAKLFLTGSAMQFRNDGFPIDENAPFDASSPYSISRIHSVYAGRYYRNTFGLKVYVGYLFNHDSPLRTEQHVNKKITATLMRIANGSREKLEIGNVEVRKEFNYAGDIVEAIWALVNQDKTHETVIGSGKAYRIRDWIEYCLRKIGGDWNDCVAIQQGYIPEYKILVSNPRTIEDIGWRPKVDFYQLADLMLDSK
jgi:GDPmannose 4,6-dehydratase